MADNAVVLNPPKKNLIQRPMDVTQPSAPSLPSEIADVLSATPPLDVPKTPAPLAPMGPPAPPELTAPQPSSPVPLDLKSSSIPPPPPVMNAIGNSTSEQSLENISPAAPQVKDHKSVLDHIKDFLPLVGAIGAGMEAAGEPNQPHQGAEMLARMNEAARQREMEMYKTQTVDQPRAQAYSDYTSGRNEASLERARIQAQGNANVAQIKNQVGVAKNHLAALQAGFVPIFDGTGRQTGLRAATKEEIAQAPMLQAHLDHMTAQGEVADAQAKLDLAHQDVLMNPNNPTFLQNERKIQAMLAMAQRKLSVSEQGLAIRNAEFQLNNGVSVNGAPPAITAPGEQLDQAGNPVGKKFQGNVGPTAAAKGRGEQAQAIEIVGRGLVDQIKANESQLGPLMGRYNSLADWFGAPDPQYKGLKAALESWIALHPAAHGFRGLNAVKQFEKAFGSTINTPEALIAGIEGSYGTMQGLQEVGSPKVIGGGGNHARPQKPNVATPQSTGPRPTGWPAPKGQ